MYSTEKQKEEEFLRLMKKHGGIIWAVMKKYRNLIEEHDKQDFEQEIWMTVWKNFHRYKPLEVCEFSSWLWPTCEWAIFKFSRKLKGKEMSLPEWFVVPDEYPDEEYDEDHINGLYRAIASFDGQERDIFTKYADGYDLETISASVGLTKSAVSHRLQRGYQRIREEAPKYFDVVPRMYKGPYLSRRGSNNPLSNRIAQVSMDGRVVAVFDSAGEAGRNGFDGRRVMEVICGKRRSYKGYYWKYDQEETIDATVTLCA